MGLGIAQWLECQIHDQKVSGPSPCRSGVRIIFSRVNLLCWLFLFHCFQYLIFFRVNLLCWLFLFQYPTFSMVNLMCWLFLFQYLTFSRVNLLCWLFVFQCVPPLCYRSSTRIKLKDPSHFARSAGGMLRLNTQAPYHCSSEWGDTVSRCKVVWCVWSMSRDSRGFARHEPWNNQIKKCCKYITSVGIQSAL